MARTAMATSVSFTKTPRRRERSREAFKNLVNPLLLLGVPHEELLPPRARRRRAGSPREPVLHLAVGPARERVPPQARLPVGEQDEDAEDVGVALLAQQEPLVLVQDDDAAPRDEVVLLERARPPLRHR